MAITLGILTGIITALAIWVGYLNSQAKDEQQNHLTKELNLKKKNEKELSDLKGRIAEANSEYSGTLVKIIEQFDIRDDKEATKAKLKSDLTNLESEVKGLEAELADYQDKLPDIGDVDRLIKNLGEAQEAIEKIDVSISQVEEENRRLTAEIAQQNENIEYNEKWIKNHTEFRSQESLKGSVTAVYGDWGFVVIGQGDIKGVTPRSILSVVRADEIIGELQVKTSTNKASTAEILFDTFKEGDFVQVGDTVIAKPVAEEVVVTEPTVMEDQEINQQPVEEEVGEPEPAPAPSGDFVDPFEL